MTLDELNALDHDGFVSTLGNIFEHSPWVAQAAFAGRPFGSVDDLHAAMAAEVEAAGEERQLALIRAHPDLAGKAARAGGLTAESIGEQKGAGLDMLSDVEFGEFHRLNDAYKARFGFPFILAVRGHDKHSILAAFRSRLQHDAETERADALGQIARIARFRLEDLTG
jgi:2-oxo-4-hydroxy-4-carboxy-5-ureidoimidazoline decarboxylase